MEAAAIVRILDHTASSVSSIRFIPRRQRRFRTELSGFSSALPSDKLENIFPFFLRVKVYVPYSILPQALLDGLPKLDDREREGRVASGLETDWSRVVQSQDSLLASPPQVSEPITVQSLANVFFSFHNHPFRPFF